MQFLIFYSIRRKKCLTFLANYRRASESTPRVSKFSNSRYRPASFRAFKAKVAFIRKEDIGNCFKHPIEDVEIEKPRGDNGNKMIHFEDPVMCSFIPPSTGWRRQVPSVFVFIFPVTRSFLKNVLSLISRGSWVARPRQPLRTKDMHCAMLGINVDMFELSRNNEETPCPRMAHAVQISLEVFLPRFASSVSESTSTMYRRFQRRRHRLQG